MIGTVKWFDPVKGFGFIKPDEGKRDVFVHTSEVRRANISELNEGDKVSYEVKSGPKGDNAVDLKVVI